MFGLNSRKRKIAAKARAIDIKDYHNLCRLCITKTSNKVNIFHEDGIRNQLFEKILNCLSLFVSEDDELPKYVCNGCINRLEDVEAFKDKCHESEEILKTYVSFDISKGKRAKKKKRQQKSVEDRINEAETVFLERAIKQEQEDFDDVDGVIDVVHGQYPQIGLEAFGSNIDNSMNQEDSLDSVSECGIASTSSLTTSKGNNSETPEVFPRVLSEKDIENLFVNSSDRLENITNSDNPSNLCEMQIVVDDSEASEVAPVKSERPPSDLAACNEEADRSTNSGKFRMDSNEKLVQEVSEFMVMQHRHNKEQERQYNNCEQDVVALLVSSANEDKTPIKICQDTISKDDTVSPDYISLVDRINAHYDNSLSCRNESSDNIVNVRSAFMDPSTKRTVMMFEVADPTSIFTQRSKFMCLKCGRFFLYKKLLDAHLRSHAHPSRPTLSGVLSCRICGSTFSNKEALCKHRLTHVKEKRFPCKFCGRKFSFKNTRDRHELAHTNKKPYKCRFCPMGYSRTASVKRHERRRHLTCHTKGAETSQEFLK